MSTPPQGSTEPKSVHMIIKQRQNQQPRSSSYSPKDSAKSRSNGSSGNSNAKDNLNPVLPPLFPPAPKCIPLTTALSEDAQVYRELSSYFRSNYSIGGADKIESGFYLPRYTDQYGAPSALKAHLLHKLPDSRYPEELIKSKVSKRKTAKQMKRKIEDLPDADAEEKEDNGREGSQSPQKAKPGTDDEEEVEDEEKEENLDDDFNEEEADEEMDLGTDYAQSYFDNGEGDDDGDRGDDDDGPTYY